MSVEPWASSEAVRALYLDHHHWLKGWLRGKLNNSADAADLAQDTFIRLMRARLDDDIREPRAYLATVASRLVANFHRSRALEVAYLQTIAALPIDMVPSVEEQAVIKETLLELDRMLDGLGRKVKQAFLLAHFEGMPYAQIAARLGISLRSVNHHVAKAMAHCCLMAG